MTTTSNVLKDLAAEAGKASPPVALVATSWMNGWTIGEVAAAVTIGYVLLQAAYLVWRWREAVLAKRAGKPVAAE